MTPEQEAASKMREAAANACERVRGPYVRNGYIDRAAFEDACDACAEDIRALPLPPDPPAAAQSAEGETPETDALPVSDPMTKCESILFLHARSLERRLRERKEELKRAEAEAKRLREAFVSYYNLGPAPQTHGCDIKCDPCDCGLKDWETNSYSWEIEHGEVLLAALAAKESHD